LVGAPLANSTASRLQSRLFQPGAIYECPIQKEFKTNKKPASNKEACKQITLDTQGDVNVNDDTSLLTSIKAIKEPLHWLQFTKENLDTGV
jgi:hypothetical protein